MTASSAYSAQPNQPPPAARLALLSWRSLLLYAAKLAVCWKVAEDDTFFSGSSRTRRTLRVMA